MARPSPDHPVAIALLREMQTALGGSSDLATVTFTGDGELPSCFPVTDFAAAAVGAAALAAAEAARPDTSETLPVGVDRRLASLWFGFTLAPQGWTIPGPWDPVAGDYEAADGWIRLHTNAPHHREAALAVLGCAADKEAVAGAVRAWQAGPLEESVVAAGGCAAAMRSREAWRVHPQGQAVAAEPLVHRRMTGDEGRPLQKAMAGRPLADLRVLDLTRVLAGPVATRFLAGLGAEVLRIDPPGWDEPGIIPEVTLGKACARLDLRSAEGRETFRTLLGGADILVHGYRNGALEALGFGRDDRRAIRPGLVDVSLDAYGFTGPWAGRRGFDSLVQMSTGIAEAGMRRYGREKPTPLPVQALDHATGYLMAAAALRGVAISRRGEGGSEWLLSLARTGLLLAGLEGEPRPGTLLAAAPDEAETTPEDTAWGPARRLRPPADMEGVPLRWDTGAAALGSAPARWRS